MTAGDGAVRRFTRRYYVLCFLDDFALVYPVYVVMFLRAGLSVYDVSLLFAFWCGATLALEIPTGILADRYHRPTLLAVGLVCKGLGFACWWIGDSWTMFALGFALWSIHGSIQSGTLQSLVFDTLRTADAEHTYIRVIGRGSFYRRVAIAAAFVLGGALAAHSFTPVLIASVLTMLAGAAVARWLPEAPRAASATEDAGPLDAFRDAWRDVRTNAAVRRVMLFAVLGIAVYGMLDEYDQIYRDWLGMPLVWFGVWSAVLMGGQALAARAAHRIGGRHPGRAKYACSAVAAVSLCLAAVWPSYAVLAVYACAFFVMAVAEVLADAELQQEIRSSRRATVTSVASLLQNATGIGLALLFGVLSDTVGLQAGYLAFAGLLLLASVPGLRPPRAPLRAGRQTTPGWTWFG